MKHILLIAVALLGGLGITVYALGTSVHRDTPRMAAAQAASPTFTLTPQTLVRDVVANAPATMPMLQALGIDYCCGGKQTLTAAAAKVKLPVNVVVAVLQITLTQTTQEAPATVNWQTAPLGELVTHIQQTHHAYLRTALPRLEKTATLVVRVHGPRHGKALQPLVARFATLKKELDAHLTQEETVVFPAIIRPDAREKPLAEISALERTHDQAGALLAEMRTITHDYQLPEDACASFAALYTGLQELERDLHQHVHLENNILFPRARAQAAP